MSTARIRFWGVVLSATIVCAAISAGVMITRGSFAAEAKDSRLSQLLNEKLDILKSVVEQMEKLHTKGEAGFEELYEAHLAMHRAQIDLCKTDKDRIAVYEELLGEARRREKAVKAPGVASSMRIHRAEVDRLDIEIELERLKLK